MTSNLGTIQNYSSEPYCTVSSFRSAPTWLDSDDLIPGGTQSKQDYELYNVLVRASSWCDRFTGGTTESPYLGASTYTQNARERTSRWGSVSIHPWKVPVQYVSEIMTGWTPQTMVSVPDITQLWIEDNRQIIIPVAGGATFAGLQFGPAVAPGGVTFVTATYDAGYFNSTLAAGTYAQGSSSLSMNNPVGLIPGTFFRVNDPGAEEVAQVAASYTPRDTAVPLVSPTLYEHTGTTDPGTAVGCSALPLDVQQACISYAVGLLMREDVSSETPFAGSEFGPATRRAAASGASSGLISEAEMILEPFRRAR